VHYALYRNFSNSSLYEWIYSSRKFSFSGSQGRLDKYPSVTITVYFDLNLLYGAVYWILKVKGYSWARRWIDFQTEPRIYSWDNSFLWWEKNNLLELADHKAVYDRKCVSTSNYSRFNVYMNIVVDFRNIGPHGRPHFKIFGMFWGMNDWSIFWKYSSIVSLKWQYWCDWYTRIPSYQLSYDLFSGHPAAIFGLFSIKADRIVEKSNNTFKMIRLFQEEW